MTEKTHNYWECLLSLTYKIFTGTKTNWAIAAPYSNQLRGWAGFHGGYRTPDHSCLINQAIEKSADRNRLHGFRSSWTSIWLRTLSVKQPLGRQVKNECKGVERWIFDSMTTKHHMRSKKIPKFVHRKTYWDCREKYKRMEILHGDKVSIIY